MSSCVAKVTLLATCLPCMGLAGQAGLPALHGPGGAGLMPSN